MKRMMACLLAIVMTLASCMGAYAQPYTAEELIGDLLWVAAEQLQHPSLGLTYSDGQTQAGLSAALDANGVPDVAVDYAADGLKMRLDADAAGVRFDDGAMKIAAAPQTLLRALFTDEAGNCFLPDAAQADLDWMAQLAGDLLEAVSGAVEIERFAAQADPAAQSAAAQEEQTIVVIDVNALLSALDAAVPELLVGYAAQIDDFAVRNSALLCEALGIDAIPKAEELAAMWPAGVLSSLLPQETPVGVTVMMGPGDACGAAVLAGEDELLLVSYGGGRLVAQLGSGEEALLMDSEDLNDVLALLVESAAYITPEAFSWRYDEDERMLRASIHLNPDRLVSDLLDGLAAAVQRSERTVSALLERYMPWLEAFGVDGAREMTWETLTQALLDNKGELAEELCWSIAYELGMLRMRMYDDHGFLPEIGLELVLPKHMTRANAASLSAYVGGTQLYAVLDRQHLGVTLRVDDRRLTRFELLGLLEENGGRMTLSRYNESRLEAEVTLNVQQADGVLSAWLNDQDGSELASFYMNGTTACLTSGGLEIEAVDTPAGLVITGREGEHRFGGQLTSDARFLNASYYFDAQNGQLQMVVDDLGFALTGAYEPGYAGLTRRAQVRLTEDEFSLYEGLYRAGMLLSCTKAEACAAADGLHLNLLSMDNGRKAELAYRPGLLEIEREQGLKSWSLRAADMTGEQENMVLVQIDVDESVRQESGWDYSERTITVRVEPDDVGVAIFEIEGLQEQPVVVTLDITVQAQAEDLTGYTWYSEAETAQLIRTLFAAPEPQAAPTADPSVSLPRDRMFIAAGSPIRGDEEEIPAYLGFAAEGAYVYDLAEGTAVLAIGEGDLLRVKAYALGADDALWYQVEDYRTKKTGVVRGLDVAGLQEKEAQALMEQIDHAPAND